MQRKGETEMTREEAIRILDPKTTGEALAEIEYYGGFSGRAAAVQAVSDACILAVAALREQEQRRWIPVTERLPDENNRWVLCLCVGGAMEVLRFDYTMRNWDSQYPRRCYMEKYVTHWMPLPEPPKEEEK